MEGLRFELWSNNGEETFIDDKNFLKNLIMMILSKDYGKLFLNLMTEMEQNILNLETFKSQLRTYYKKEINTQFIPSSNNKKLLKISHNTSKDKISHFQTIK